MAKLTSNSLKCILAQKYLKTRLVAYSSPLSCYTIINHSYGVENIERKFKDLATSKNIALSKELLAKYEKVKILKPKLCDRNVSFHDKAFLCFICAFSK